MATKPRMQKTRPAGRAGGHARLSVDDRRQQLLDLGLEVFAARPYDQVSIDEIAQMAGISRSLLFHYFASKREFHKAVIETMAARLLAATFQPFPPGFDPAANPAPLLLKGLNDYFAFVEDHAGLFAAVVGAGLGNDAGAQGVVERTRDEMATRLQAYLPPPPPGRAAAQRAAIRAWQNLVEGLALDWSRHRDLPRDERIAMALQAARIVPGVLPQPA